MGELLESPYSDDVGVSVFYLSPTYINSPGHSGNPKILDSDQVVQVV